MKIAIEAQRIYRKEKHGMDYVALEMIRELQKLDSKNEYYILVSPGEDKCLTESANMHIVEVNWPSYPLWEQIGLPLAVNRIKPDILHCTSNTAPIFCNVPLVLTLHDIIFLEKRAYSTSIYQRLGNYYRRLIVPLVAKKCLRIITVSNIEKTNITFKLRIPQERITVLHNGYNKSYKYLGQEHDVYKKYIEQPDYFFILGNTDGRKNIERMLIAYSLYLERSKIKRKLLITSLGNYYLDQLLNRHNIECIKKHISLTEYIPIEDLPYLYNSAFAFLFVSTREGFGIPILEGMACGTPVITSNTSAMPEIAGEGGILVNPFKPEEIAEKILLLEEDATYRNNCIEYGLNRVKQFSWENTAKNTLNIYQTLLK